MKMEQHSQMRSSEWTWRLQRCDESQKIKKEKNRGGESKWAGKRDNSCWVDERQSGKSQEEKHRRKDRKKERARVMRVSEN